MACVLPFAERAHWLTVEWLQNAPELNDIEVVWGRP